jgi:hypothetical protein
MIAGPVYIMARDCLSGYGLGARTTRWISAACMPGLVASDCIFGEFFTAFTTGGALFSCKVDAARLS